MSTGCRSTSKRKKKGGKRNKEGEQMTWNVGTVVIPASCWSITAGGASLAYLGIGIILRHWYHIKSLRHMWPIKVLRFQVILLEALRPLLNTFWKH